MPNFVYDNTALAFPKTDVNVLPPGANPAQYIVADDWNKAMQAMVDVKSVLRAGKWYGFEEQASDPLPAGITNYIWVNSAGVLTVKRGLSQSQVVYTSRQVLAGDGLDGGGTLNADITLSLETLPGVAGTYQKATITVDAYGRITAASTGGGAGYDTMINDVSPVAPRTALRVDGSNLVMSDDVGNGWTSLALGSALSNLDNLNFSPSEAGVGAADTGRLIYDGTTNRFKVSTNAGAYKNLLVDGEGMVMGGIIAGSPSVGSILFVGTGGSLSQNNGSFLWDDSDQSLTITSTGRNLTLHNSSSSGQADFRNTNPAGVSGFNFSDENGVLKVAWGYGNTNFLDDKRAGRAYLRKDNIDYVVTDGFPSDVQFIIDASGKVGIGGVETLTGLLHVEGTGASLVRLKNTSPSGYAAVDISSSSGTATIAAFGYANSSVLNSQLQSCQYIWRDGVPVVFYDEARSSVDAAITSSGNFVVGGSGPSKTGADHEFRRDESLRLMLSSYGLEGGSDLFLYRGRGTGEVTTAIQSGDALGSITFGGAWSSGDSIFSGAFIKGEATQNWGASATGAKIEFWTTPNGGGTGDRARRLTIDHDGTLVLGDSSSLVFSEVGVGAPTFTTRSAGTKIVLNPDVDASNADFAIGYETNAVWFSVDSSRDLHGFKWYFGNREIASFLGYHHLGGDQLTDAVSVKFGGAEASAIGWVCGAVGAAIDFDSSATRFSIKATPNADVGKGTGDSLLCILPGGSVIIGDETADPGVAFRIAKTASTTAIEMTSGSAVGAEAGRLRYNSVFQVCNDGSNWRALVVENLSLTASTGLTGGGDLSANRSFAVDLAHSFGWTAAHSWKSHANFAGSETVKTTAAVQTTDTTPTNLFTLALGDDTLYWVEVTIIGRDTAGTHRALYTKKALVYRQSAGSATLQGAVIDVHADLESDATNWDATITVSGNDAVIQVTGAATTTINWVATVHYQAVSASA